MGWQRVVSPASGGRPADPGHRVSLITSNHGLGHDTLVKDDVHRGVQFEEDLVPWRVSLTIFTQRMAWEEHKVASDRIPQLPQQFDAVVPTVTLP
jgi:hypothetical protein